MDAGRYWLVMPAAGRGQRFGAELPKQYLSLHGRSMLEWALRPFLADAACAGVMVAVSRGDAHWPALRAALGARVRDCEGGAERADSVRAALDELADFGRPARVSLAVLVDRGGRELPIQPDVVGKHVEVPIGSRVDVCVAELDGKDEVLLVATEAL